MVEAEAFLPYMASNGRCLNSLTAEARAAPDVISRSCGEDAQRLSCPATSAAPLRRRVGSAPLRGDYDFPTIGLFHRFSQ